MIELLKFESMAKSVRSAHNRLIYTYGKPMERGLEITQREAPNNLSPLECANGKKKKEKKVGVGFTNCGPCCEEVFTSIVHAC